MATSPYQPAPQPNGQLTAAAGTPTAPSATGAAPGPTQTRVGQPGTPTTPTPSPPAPAAPAAPAPAVGAPAPLPNLATDPTYMEFVRSLGLSQADAQAAADQAEAQVGARLSNSLASDKFSSTLAINRGAGGFEARGVANSGEALTGINNLRAADAFRVEALRQAAAQQLSALAEQLALQKQAGEVGLSNQGTAAAGRVFVTANPVDPLSPVGPTSP